MELADPEQSYAVLVGTSAYTHASLDHLPAVANNLRRLGELLEDPAVWGLPPGHCVRVPEPRTATEVLEAVHEAAAGATDTLLVYYAGHGLRPPVNDGLLLALPGTDPERAYTALDFEAVRQEVLATHRTANRVVILDCCYAGSVFAGGMAAAGEATAAVADRARIAGSYVLAACARTASAQAPPGERYTAFTGELIRLLERGLPGAGPYIEAAQAYEHLYAELLRKGRPLPQQRLSNAGRTLVLARNQYPLAAPRRDREPDRPPVAEEDDWLLTEVTRKAAPEVVALIAQAYQDNRHDQRYRLLDAVRRLPPDRCVEVYVQMILRYPLDRYFLAPLGKLPEADLEAVLLRLREEGKAVPLVFFLLLVIRNDRDRATQWSARLAAHGLGPEAAVLRTLMDEDEDVPPPLDEPLDDPWPRPPTAAPPPDGQEQALHMRERAYIVGALLTVRHTVADAVVADLVRRWAADQRYTELFALLAAFHDQRLDDSINVALRQLDRPALQLAARNLPSPDLAERVRRLLGTH